MHFLIEEDLTDYFTWVADSRIDRRLEICKWVGNASGRSNLRVDTKTILRILCHGSDSEASHFLKKQFKIPRSAAA